MLVISWKSQKRIDYSKLLSTHIPNPYYLQFLSQIQKSKERKRLLLIIHMNSIITY